MKLDDSIVELVRTCLKEEWDTDDVSDDQVKNSIELAIIDAISRDLHLEVLTLPKTKKALNSYYSEKGCIVRVGGGDDEET